MKTILLTGGLGYIGSHVAVELLQLNFKVVIVDNLSNSKPQVLDRIKKITNKELCNPYVISGIKIIYKMLAKSNFCEVILVLF